MSWVIDFATQQNVGVHHPVGVLNAHAECFGSSVRIQGGQLTRNSVSDIADPSAFLASRSCHFPIEFRDSRFQTLDGLLTSARGDG